MLSGKALNAKFKSARSPFTKGGGPHPQPLSQKEKGASPFPFTKGGRLG
jgi:hypothetical protein